MVARHQNHHPYLFLPDFHKSSAQFCAADSVGFRRKPRNSALNALRPPQGKYPAPFLLHQPVNAVHFIEFQVDAHQAFLLTLKMDSVKRQSFFDSF
jgi:hypothetical protein